MEITIAKTKTQLQPCRQITKAILLVSQIYTPAHTLVCKRRVSHACAVVRQWLYENQAL